MPGRRACSCMPAGGQPMTTRKWGQEQLVNSTKAGEQFHPSVTALDSGGYLIVWEDDGFGVRGQRYGAAGDVVGSEFTVNGGEAFALPHAGVVRLSSISGLRAATALSGGRPSHSGERPSQSSSLL